MDQHAQYRLRVPMILFDVVWRLDPQVRYHIGRIMAFYCSTSAVRPHGPLFGPVGPSIADKWGSTQSAISTLDVTKDGLAVQIDS
jgi:hypothetical protein